MELEVIGLRAAVKMLHTGGNGQLRLAPFTMYFEMATKQRLDGPKVAEFTFKLGENTQCRTVAEGEVLSILMPWKLE